jgi:hypothetical protein
MANEPVPSKPLEPGLYWICHSTFIVELRWTHILRISGISPFLRAEVCSLDGGAWNDVEVDMPLDIFAADSGWHLGPKIVAQSSPAALPTRSRILEDCVDSRKARGLPEPTLA